MLTPRAHFEKFRKAWWTIAPRGPMQSGGRDRTSPPLCNFLEAARMLTPRARTARVSKKFEKHGGPLPPAGLCKAGGEAERAPRFVIFLEAARMLTPRAHFKKIPKAWRTIALHGPMQSGRRARTSPPLCIFLGNPPRCAKFAYWSGVSKRNGISRPVSRIDFAGCRVLAQCCALSVQMLAVALAPLAVARSLCRASRR